MPLVHLLPKDPFNKGEEQKSWDLASMTRLQEAVTHLFFCSSSSSADPEDGSCHAITCSALAHVTRSKKVDPNGNRTVPTLMYPWRENPASAKTLHHPGRDLKTPPAVLDVQQDCEVLTAKPQPGAACYTATDNDYTLTSSKCTADLIIRLP